MKRFIFTGLICFIACSVFAQNVLMHQEVKNDSVKTTFGPNRKTFTHFYAGYGLILGEPDHPGSAINYGKSSTFAFGFRYKLKVCKVYSVGFNLEYMSYAFNLKQDSNKTLPNSMLHDKEKMSLNTLGLGLYMRFNYGRRGDRIGKFVDLGGYGDWVFAPRHFMEDKQDNGNVIETTIKKLNYYNIYEYGLLANIGFNKFVIFGKYRMSDLFEKSYTFSEMPRLTVGLQIGFHK